MKIRLVRDDLRVPPNANVSTDSTVVKNGAVYWKLGSVLDVPARGCELLVGNGDAEPADEDAEMVCKGWKDKRPEVLLSRAMLAAGIEPEDRELFRAGEILGYDETGNYIPGPNWSGDAEDEEQESGEI